jgi:hypothetical protein
VLGCELLGPTQAIGARRRMGPFAGISGAAARPIPVRFVLRAQDEDRAASQNRSICRYLGERPDSNPRPPGPQPGTRFASLQVIFRSTPLHMRRSGGSCHEARLHRSRSIPGDPLWFRTQSQGLGPDLRGSARYLRGRTTGGLISRLARRYGRSGPDKSAGADPVHAVVADGRVLEGVEAVTTQDAVTVSDRAKPFDNRASVRADGGDGVE